MLRGAWSSNLVYNAPYLGLRVQRSLILSSVPTLRRKKGHRRQKQASLYPSYASTWIVYGYELLILLLIPTLWKVYGYEKLVSLLIPTLWKVCGYEKLVSLLIPTLWQVCGYGKLVLLLIPTLWQVCGYGKLVLLLIPTLWKVWGYEKLVSLLIPTLWKVCGYEKLVLLLIPKLWKSEGITRELYISECLRHAFVGSTAALRYEPCTQFINVSQKDAPHLLAVLRNEPRYS